MDTEDRSYRVEVLAAVGHAAHLPMEWRSKHESLFTLEEAFQSMRRFHQAQLAARVVDSQNRVLPIVAGKNAYQAAELVLRFRKNNPQQTKLTIYTMAVANDHDILIGLAELLSIGALTANGRYQINADETKLNALCKALEGNKYHAAICLQSDASRA